MTLYRYQAYGPSGNELQGTIEAPSLPTALSILRQKGLNPYLAEPETASPHSYVPALTLSKRANGLEWRSRTVRQLATLLGAGITLDRAIRLLAGQGSRTQKSKMETLLAEVIAGRSLAASLSKAELGFRADEIGLLRAGEQTGSLVPVLDELAGLLERQHDMRKKLTSALVYPAFLLALAPVSLIIIGTILVPNLAPLFEHSDAAMPFVLRAMIWVSDEFRANGLFWSAIVLVLALVFLALLRTPHFTQFVGSWSGRLPLIGTIRRRSAVSRLCRALGSLLRSGAPLQTALMAIAEVMSDAALKKSLARVKGEVAGGAKLGSALKAVTCLDQTALQMIAIGEESNKLDTMLTYVADSEEKALSSYLERLVSLLTPLLTVAIGLLVGGIVMSIMRAILSVNELVAQ